MNQAAVSQHRPVAVAGAAVLISAGVNHRVYIAEEIVGKMIIYHRLDSLLFIFTPMSQDKEYSGHNSPYTFDFIAV